MKLVIGILLVVLVFALVEYFANIYHMLGKTKNTTASTMNAKPVVEKKEIPNCLTYRINGEECKARFENGTVYAKSKYMDDYVIGYYANEDGHWKVKCANDKGEIGRIMPDDTSALVYFNRLGDLERYKKLQKKIAETNSWFTEEEQERQYNNAVRNIKLTWLCAEAFGGFIQDIDTYETIATSSGNDLIGAAAAFICLQYEVVMDGKYHAFYSAIN